jgi:hypothetical protein
VRGWKTKTGSILFGVGGVLVSSAGSCPVAEYAWWLDVAGKILMAVGGGLGMYGIGHKVDKLGNGL